MENTLAKKIDPSAEYRSRLIALGRESGMSDAQLNLALRVGNVSRISGGRLRCEKRYRRASVPFRMADLDRISTAFLAALDATKWPAVTMDDIRSASRCRRYSKPRQVLAALLRSLTPAPLETIAAYLSRLDHATIMHACKVAPVIEEDEPELSAAADVVRAILPR